ncbi:MAG TPA: hypothetical protein VMF52_20635 [Steroidobacteraceae bacterium]|nr:hypothetical protein [Steroidobacteraceae bacterium]
MRSNTALERTRSTSSAKLVRLLARRSAWPLGDMTNLLDLMDRGLSGIAFDIVPLVRELSAYGEHETAAWLGTIDADTHAKISTTASRVITAGMIIDKAICLAAVEVREGASRPLRRNRRSYKLAQFLAVSPNTSLERTRER